MPPLRRRSPDVTDSSCALRRNAAFPSLGKILESKVVGLVSGRLHITDKKDFIPLSVFLGGSRMYQKLTIMKTHQTILLATRATVPTHRKLIKLTIEGRPLRSS